MKAVDFIKQLEQNPEYREMQRLKEEQTKKKLSEIRMIEAPFIKLLHENGFNDINKAGDLLDLKKINTKLTALLLDWIPQMSNRHGSQEMLVRALAKADKPFDGKLLKELFDSKDNTESFKWVVGNTIASANVENVNDWLKRKLRAVAQPKQNEMLVYAAIKYFTYEQASVILKNLFKFFPLQVADAFTYIGKKGDLLFLEENSIGLKKEIKNRIDKAIKKIEKSL